MAEHIPQAPKPCPTCGLKRYAPAHFEDTNAYIEALEARCEAAEMDLGMAQVRVKFLTDENEKLQDLLQTPVDDRRLAEIRARVNAPLNTVITCALALEPLWAAEHDGKALSPEMKGAVEDGVTACRAFMDGPHVDTPYLLEEVARLRGTLASYADGKKVERKAEASHEQY